jgi:hypothetical protein
MSRHQRISTLPRPHLDSNDEKWYAPPLSENHFPAPEAAGCTQLPVGAGLN